MEVKEATFEAFHTLVKYIYKPPGDENSFNLDHIRCPQKLFELLSLATQDQIWKLADALEGLTITTESMIFTATVAKNHKGSFDEISNKLTVKCIKFLIDTTSGGGDICTLIKETVNNFPEANPDILWEVVEVGTATLQLSGIL